MLTAHGHEQGWDTRGKTTLFDCQLAAHAWVLLAVMGVPPNLTEQHIIALCISDDDP